MAINPDKVVISPSTIDAPNRVQMVNLGSNFYWWSASGQWALHYYGYFKWLPLSTYQSNGSTWSGAIVAPYQIYSGQLGYEIDYSPKPIAWTIGGGIVGGTYSDSNYGVVGGNTTLQKLTCDRTYRFKAVAYTSVENDSGGSFPVGQRNADGSEEVNVKTNPASAGAAVAHSISSITFNSATIGSNYYTPNTYESVVTVKIQIKKSTDIAWSDVITYSNQSGYNPVSYGPLYLTGLSSSTLYNVRVWGHRYTNPEDDFYSTTVAFTTLASTPDITTGPATDVGADAASLHGVVHPHTLSTFVTFIWGTTSGVYPNTADPGFGSTGDTSQDVSYPLTGLTPGQTYFYKAKATYPGGTIYGSEVSFTTTADPSAEAKDEDLMQTIQYDGKYGTAKTISFTLKPYASSSSNIYYSSTAPTKNEVELYHTTAAGATTKHKAFATGITNSPARPGSGILYTITLDAGEMSADVIDIIVRSAGTAFRDEHLQVRTSAQLTSLDLDATNAAVDTTAFSCIGKGSGDGIKAVGGITGLDINAIFESNWLRVFAPGANSSGATLALDSGASATNDYYIGSQICVIGGGIPNGQGQARVIIAYDGTSKIATVDSAWTTQVKTDAVCVIAPGARTWEMKPSAELSTVPSPVDSYGKYLQLIFQRFAFKIMQETQAQTWFDSNDTEKFIRTVYDDGGTQKLERLSDV